MGGGGLVNSKKSGCSDIVGNVAGAAVRIFENFFKYCTDEWWGELFGKRDLLYEEKRPTIGVRDF
jgi:hypothetical protein